VDSASKSPLWPPEASSGSCRQRRQRSRAAGTLGELRHSRSRLLPRDDLSGPLILTFSGASEYQKSINKKINLDPSILKDSLYLRQISACVSCEVPLNMHAGTCRFLYRLCSINDTYSLGLSQPVKRNLDGNWSIDVKKTSIMKKLSAGNILLKCFKISCFYSSMLLPSKYSIQLELNKARPWQGITEKATKHGKI
jgi:hypothetical protein